MVWHGIGQIQSTKPPISQIEMNLFAKTPLGADPIDTADQQHPDHQFRVDLGAACVAIEWLEMATDRCQINEAINGPQKMVLRHVPLK